MSSDQKIYKAILLLDRGNFEQGEILLREIVDECEKDGDYINFIRGVVCLADFLYSKGKFSEATNLLKKATKSSNNNVDDLLDSEFKRAEELLKLMD